MRAMILAAGRGERLRPLTDSRPKPLVEVGGRCLIDYAIDACRDAGITSVIVNLHHLGDQIREHLGDGREHGVDISYSEEHSLQGSGGGIREARELIGDSSFVTLNADTIIRVDLAHVIAAHRERNATATLVLRKDPRMREFGLIQIDASDRIGAFLEARRPGAAETLDPFMYTGVQVLESRVFDYMPETGAFSISAVTYPDMLRAEERLFGYRFDGTFITVGTPEELASAERTLASGAA